MKINKPVGKVPEWVNTIAASAAKLATSESENVQTVTRRCIQTRSGKERRKSGNKKIDGISSGTKRLAHLRRLMSY